MPFEIAPTRAELFPVGDYRRLGGYTASLQVRLAARKDLSVPGVAA